MANVVNFNMIVEINQLLNDKGLEYSIHSVGGCTCSGLQLKGDGKEQCIKEVILIINEYLDDKWMRVIPKEENPLLLDIVSKFNHE